MKFKLVNFLIEQKILLVIIGIGLLLSFTSDYFLSFNNIMSILAYISIEGIIVYGMAYLIILKELDLSVGSIMALSGFFAIYFQRFGIIAGVAAGITIGILIGLINGLLVVKYHLNSIVTTLGMMLLLNGVVFKLTDARSVIGINGEFKIISNTEIFGINLSIFYFIIFFVILNFILKRTFIGRNIFAVGGNETAARFVGINVDRIKIYAFMLSGFLSGFAGVLMASKLNIASGRIGMNTAILVITAALLGGVSLSGGEGDLFKVLQGILLLGLLKNAMVLLQVSIFYQDVISGLMLIGILVIDAISSRRKKYL